MSGQDNEPAKSDGWLFSQYIGEGAYGMVVSAFDNETKTKVGYQNKICSVFIWEIGTGTYKYV